VTDIIIHLPSLPLPPYPFLLPLSKFNCRSGNQLPREGDKDKRKGPGEEKKKKSILYTYNTYRHSPTKSVPISSNQIIRLLSFVGGGGG
jgi:hypothetical protein